MHNVTQRLGAVLRTKGAGALVLLLQSLIKEGDLEDLCKTATRCSKGGECAGTGGACSSPTHSAFPDELKQHVKVARAPTPPMQASMVLRA